MKIFDDQKRLDVFTKTMNDNCTTDEDKKHCDDLESKLGHGSILLYFENNDTLIIWIPTKNKMKSVFYKYTSNCRKEKIRDYKYKKYMDFYLFKDTKLDENFGIGMKICVQILSFLRDNKLLLKFFDQDKIVSNIFHRYEELQNIRDNDHDGKCKCDAIEEFVVKNLTKNSGELHLRFMKAILARDLIRHKEEYNVRISSYQIQADLGDGKLRTFSYNDDEVYANISAYLLFNFFNNIIQVYKLLKRLYKLINRGELNVCDLA